MRYLITEKNNNDCRVALISENDVEKELLSNSKGNEDTMIHYYQQALEQKINPNAVFLELVEYSYYPSPVTISYQIAKGLGE